jgi:hypothetical protein
MIGLDRYRALVLRDGLRVVAANLFETAFEERGVRAFGVGLAELADQLLEPRFVGDARQQVAVRDAVLVRLVRTADLLERFLRDQQVVAIERRLADQVLRERMLRGQQDRLRVRDATRAIQADSAPERDFGVACAGGVFLFEQREEVLTCTVGAEQLAA